MSINSNEFHGLVRSTIKNKIKSKKPTVKAPKMPKEAKQRLVPYQTPSQRVGLS